MASAGRAIEQRGRALPSQRAAGEEGRERLAGQ